jgi:AcrR family transcriptional regulator
MTASALITFIFMATGRSTAEILVAARQLFEIRGLDGFTMHEFAQYAGVSKTSIYSRWRTKDAILIDLLAQEFGATVRTDDTGTTEGDIDRLVDDLARAIVAANGIVTNVVGALSRNEDLRLALRSGTAEFHSKVFDVFERAIARGDLAPDADVELAALIAIGPLSYLIEHQLPVPADLVQRIATHIRSAFSPAKQRRTRSRKPLE